MRYFCSANPILMGFLSLTCGDGGSYSEVMVRDSAGIHIVANTGSMLERGLKWRVDEAPSLDIGMSDSDPNYEFYRVTGATQMPDGRLAVLNAGTCEIRFFEETGVYLHSAGRQGDGPGEFRWPAGIWTFAGDSLLVWDTRLQRLSVFSNQGNFVRSVYIQPRFMNPPAIAGVFGDGTLLFTDHFFDPGRVGFKDQYTYLLHYDLSGRLVDSLTVHPFGKLGVVGESRRGVVAGPLFQGRSVFAVGDWHYYVGEGDSHEILVYDILGKITRIIRWNGESLDVTKHDVELYKHELLSAEMNPDQRRLARERLEQLPASEKFPAYESIRLDADGNVWVMSYRRPGDNGPARWVVIDSEGWVIGQIHTERGLEVLEIGDTYILGLARDSEDIEHLQRFTIYK